MKLTKFRIAVLVLLAVTTVVYAVTLHQSVQTYNEWREEERQKYAEQYQGYVPSYTHFLTTKTGIVFDVAGITLFFAWSIAILSKNKKAKYQFLCCYWEESSSTRKLVRVYAKDGVTVKVFQV